MHRRLFLAILLSLIPFSGEAKLPEIKEPDVTDKLNEIMGAHVTHKELNDVIVKRAFSNFLEVMDPGKVYFIKSEIQAWLEPESELVSSALRGIRNHDFTVFQKMHDAMIVAIKRRNELEDKLVDAEIPESVDPKEFKDLDWAESVEALEERLLKLRSLREQALVQLGEDVRELSRQRVQKRRLNLEEDFLEGTDEERHRFFLSNVLKAAASALDSHTAYFTPGEATQFMINVQQRLFGIGAQLRDDITGFSVVKIIEGGPASQGKELQNKDRIIAVDGEPVVGYEITEVVEFIRGKAGTQVTLTVVREVENEEGKKEEQTLDVVITRGEVVLKETRIEADYEPFGDGVIAYVKLYSFYQDSHSSSAGDVAYELDKLKKDHNVKGVVLDLRYNSGGMLSQAVAVTGLFISKGIVVSIKDSSGQLQHLRDTDGRMVYDGPLIVLTNKASASASEIVAQTLQDYGRAIVVGDHSTYGKGSFQTFTLNHYRRGGVNPQGEYKVTRGCYYTVSGKSPQQTGVSSDVIVPGLLSKLDIGEQFAKFPLENDTIPANFEDKLEDVPQAHRERIEKLYNFNLQPIVSTYSRHLGLLRQNSSVRIEKDKNYQKFLEEIAKEDVELDEQEMPPEFGKNDLQLTESFNIMKDLIILLDKGGLPIAVEPK